MVSFPHVSSLKTLYSPFPSTIYAVLFNQILIPPPPAVFDIAVQETHHHLLHTCIGSFILRPGILLLRLWGFCYDNPESENSVVSAAFCVCLVIIHFASLRRSNFYKSSITFVPHDSLYFRRRLLSPPIQLSDCRRTFIAGLVNGTTHD